MGQMWRKLIPLQVLKRHIQILRGYKGVRIQENIHSDWANQQKVIPAHQLKQHSPHELHTGLKECHNKGHQQ